MEHLEEIISQLIKSGVDLGKNILTALVIYFVGRYLIKIIKNVTRNVMEKREIDPAVRSFIGSMINIGLTVLLVIAVISTLGIETTSFAALLASAGVAIGMALSGNLQNFAGGLMILLFKPYKIGDYVETTNAAGTVKEIQIFSTILTTPDNKTIFVPNGTISNGVLTNYSRQDKRRVDWGFNVSYGTDCEKVNTILTAVLTADKRILKDPPLFIGLRELSGSSINFTVRAWVENADFWNVYFDINKKVYETFNEKGIEFPFPQLTVHQAKD